MVVEAIDDQPPTEEPAWAYSPQAIGLQDADWDEDAWRGFLESLIDASFLSWKQIGAAVLGSLNPPQAGTALASSAGFKARYGKGSTMKVVMQWLYEQAGACVDCGARLELQADHVLPKEGFENPLDADYIENMVLRCRRCNVIRRPSHLLGGKTHLTAEAALMWILLVIRPRTFLDFVRLCRLYGMSMADIRMAEAWAMAHWLTNLPSFPYSIEDEEASYDLLKWSDNAITRRGIGENQAGSPETLYSSVSGADYLAFVCRDPMSNQTHFHQYPVRFIPFSGYDLGTRGPQEIAITGKLPKLGPLPPRDQELLCHQVRSAEQKFVLADTSHSPHRILLECPAEKRTQKKLTAEWSDLALATEPT